MLYARQRIYNIQNVLNKDENKNNININNLTRKNIS